MDIRCDTYLGGEHLYIVFVKGTHEVRCTVENGEITIVFRGWWERCVEFIREREIAYLEARVG